MVSVALYICRLVVIVVMSRQVFRLWLRLGFFVRVYVHRLVGQGHVVRGPGVVVVVIVIGLGTATEPNNNRTVRLRVNKKTRPHSPADTLGCGGGRNTVGGGGGSGDLQAWRQLALCEQAS